jgi:hypothetical protein
MADGTKAVLGSIISTPSSSYVNLTEQNACRRAADVFNNIRVALPTYCPSIALIEALRN